MTRMEERIRRALSRAPKKTLTFWQLARQCGYVPDVVATLRRLERDGSVACGDTRVRLLDANRAKGPAKDPRGVVERAIRGYAKVRAGIRFDREDFDQLGVLPEGIEAKLSLMLRADDLAGRDVLCIGDDDLYSVACAYTGLPRSITVFDADPKVVRTLRAISPKLPVPIRVRTYNFLRAVPSAERGRFDVFVTEPPDTPKGMELFLARGMQCLGPGGVAYFGMTDVTLSRTQWRQVQLAVLNAGFAITDAVRDAEPYEAVGQELLWKGFERLPKWIRGPAEAPWFVSTLFRAEAVARPRPPRVTFREAARELITSLQ